MEGSRPSSCCDQGPDRSGSPRQAGGCPAEPARSIDRRIDAPKEALRISEGADGSHEWRRDSSSQDAVVARLSEASRLPELSSRSRAALRTQDRTVSACTGRRDTRHYVRPRLSAPFSLVSRLWPARPSSPERATRGGAGFPQELGEPAPDCNILTGSTHLPGFRRRNGPAGGTWANRRCV